MSAARHKRLGTRMATSTILAVCLIALSPIRVAAWGREGHQIVAGIAENYLKIHSPQALIKAKQLLSGQSLVDAATFADDVRNSRPYTKNWHFVDIPLNQDSYDPARDCRAVPNGDCSVQAFLRFQAVLADRSEDPCVRAEALRFIVHLVGDIHQPLHNINDDDAGGNGKKVRFFGLRGFRGGAPNLHEVWDNGIIEHSGKSIAQFVTDLSGHDDPGISMDVLTWVRESHWLAQSAYNTLTQPDAQHVFVLDSDDKYFNAGLRVVSDQLAKAGLRLGKVLEKALG